MDCIRDKETKEYFNYIKRKHSMIKINEPENVEGEVIIKSIRKYPSTYYLNINFRYEVDIEFKGCVWGRGFWSDGCTGKLEHRFLHTYYKIKVYRLIRKKIMSELRTKLSLFDIELDKCESITKLKWVE
jgi:hypothetical protein